MDAAQHSIVDRVHPVQQNDYSPDRNRAVSYRMTTAEVNDPCTTGAQRACMPRSAHRFSKFLAVFVLAYKTRDAHKEAHLQIRS